MRREDDERNIRRRTLKNGDEVGTEDGRREESRNDEKEGRLQRQDRGRLDKVHM